MGIISVVMDNSMLSLRYKAPKNHMYRVTDIHGSVISNGNNQGVWVIPYLVEPERIAFNPQGEFLAFIVCHIAGQSIDFEFMNAENTKFISLVRRLDANFECAIVIHYELIKASKKELILEWFRKGR